MLRDFPSGGVVGVGSGDIDGITLVGFSEGDEMEEGVDAVGDGGSERCFSGGGFEISRLVIHGGDQFAGEMMAGFGAREGVE